MFDIYILLLVECENTEDMNHSRVHCFCCQYRSLIENINRRDIQRKMLHTKQTGSCFRALWRTRSVSTTKTHRTRRKTIKHEMFLEKFYLYLILTWYCQHILRPRNGTLNDAHLVLKPVFRSWKPHTYKTFVGNIIQLFTY